MDTASATGPRRMSRAQLVAASLIAIGLVVGGLFGPLAASQSNRNDKNASDYGAACRSAAIGGRYPSPACAGANEQSIALEVSLALAGLAVMLLGVGVLVTDWVRRDPTAQKVTPSP